MTTAQVQKMQKMAAESAHLARKALQKSNEVEAYLSLLEYREGRMNPHSSVRSLIRKARA